MRHNESKRVFDPEWKIAQGGVSGVTRLGVPRQSPASKYPFAAARWFARKVSASIWPVVSHQLAGETCSLSRLSEPAYTCHTAISGILMH